MVGFHHPIQVVARLSGLSPHVIRVWEKRYGAVAPGRTGTNRRLYTDDDVERLRLLARATAAGHKIGIIARLPCDDLRRLVSTVSPDDGPAVTDAPRSRGGGGNGNGAGNHPSPGVEMGVSWSGNGHGGPAYLREALSATMSFNADALQHTLERAAVAFGHNGMLHRLICPLAHELGELWQKGAVTAAHEHFASAAIREFLARCSRPFAARDGAARLIVATPAGQLHELGALLVAAAANNLGWRSIYLGASLPAAEIAGAAIQNGARAVLLSVVYPADDPGLPADLEQLRRQLPHDVPIVVGGRATESYGPTLRRIGAIQVGSLEDLYALLPRLQDAGAAQPVRHRDADQPVEAPGSGVR